MDTAQASRAAALLGPTLPYRGQVRYTGELATRGYRLNALICSLADESNRQDFKADEDSYAMRFHLNEHERSLLRERNLVGMFDYGVNIYAVAKAAVVFGGSVAMLGEQMRARQGGTG